MSITPIYNRQQVYETLSKRGVEKQYQDIFYNVYKSRNEEGSEVSAKQFLSQCTVQELYAIQKANSSARRINVDSLTEEGAYNLLVAPGDRRNYVDIDNDGIVEVGAAKTFIVPNPNAPDEVKDAWEKLTKDMTLKERLLVEGPFLVRQDQANLRKLPNGRYTMLQPGDQGYTNGIGNDVNSYLDFIDETIERFSNHPNRYDSEYKEQIEFRINFFLDFKKELMGID